MSTMLMARKKANIWQKSDEQKRINVFGEMVSDLLQSAIKERGSILPRGQFFKAANNLLSQQVIEEALISSLTNWNFDLEVRLNATLVLGELGGKKVAAKLVNILQRSEKLSSQQDDDIKMRLAFMNALKTIGGIEATLTLINIAVDQKQPFVLRVAALENLEELGSGGSVNMLEKSKPSISSSEQISTRHNDIQSCLDNISNLINDTTQDSFLIEKAKNVIGYLKQTIINSRYQLKALNYWRLGEGEQVKARVVVLSPEGKILQAEGEGNGPVNASYLAINQIIPQTRDFKLDGFYVTASIIAGTEAHASVSITTINTDIKSTGNHVDIVFASALAYIALLNNLREQLEYGNGAKHSVTTSTPKDTSISTAKQIENVHSVIY